MQFSPDDLRMLRDLPLFQRLGDADLRRIAAAATLRSVPQGGFFFFQDDPAGRVYSLLRGRVKLGQVTSDGQQIILRVIGEGSMFGVIAMVPEATYPISAEAARDCQALSWERETLLRFAEEIPQMAVNAMKILSGHVREFQERIRELSTERVERRIARVLLRLAGQVGRKTDEGVLVDLAISRQDIAEMSGTTLYTVSRTLSQWEKKGLIDAGREKVLIRQPHGLVMIAEDLAAPQRGVRPREEGE